MGGSRLEILIAFVCAAIAGLLARVIDDEWQAWNPKISGKILRFAASKLPSRLQDSLHSEWASVLEDIPGRIGKLVFALDLIRAAMLIQAGEKKILAPVRKAELMFGIRVVSGAAVSALFGRLEKLYGADLPAEVIVAPLNWMLRGDGNYTEALTRAAAEYDEVGDQESADDLRRKVKEREKQLLERIADVALIYGIRKYLESDGKRP